MSLCSNNSRIQAGEQRDKDECSHCILLIFFDFFVLSFDLDLLRIGRTTLPFCSFIAGMILVRTLQGKHGVTDSGTVSNANLSRGPLVHAVMSNNIRVT